MRIYIELPASEQLTLGDFEKHTQMDKRTECWRINVTISLRSSEIG